MDEGKKHTKLRRKKITMIRMFCINVFMVISLVSCSRIIQDTEKSAENMTLDNQKIDHQKQDNQTSNNKEQSVIGNIDDASLETTEPDNSSSTVVDTLVPEQTIQDEVNIINPEGQTLESRILEPEGYTRIETSEDSLAAFLRNYPVKEDNSPVPSVVG